MPLTSGEGTRIRLAGYFISFSDLPVLEAVAHPKVVVPIHVLEAVMHPKGGLFLTERLEILMRL